MFEVFIWLCIGLISLGLWKFTKSISRELDTKKRGDRAYQNLVEDRYGITRLYVSTHIPLVREPE